MSKFLTWEYTDGSTITQEHDSIMDGEWEYGEDCVEVIFKINNTNPLYTKED